MSKIKPGTRHGGDESHHMPAEGSLNLNLASSEKQEDLSADEDRSIRSPSLLDASLMLEEG